MEPLGVGDPERVGDFVISARLGAGGMGEVFLGRSQSGRAVAVKVVHPHLARQAEFRRRFQREVDAARTVSGAFTAPVMAAGPEDDRPWIATLYIPGPPLSEAVAKAGAFTKGSVWPLAAGLVEALQAIHTEGLLHRDLKPSNVLLAADGPRMIDFGIARAMDGTALTATGMTVGTPGFMSPEQVEGGVVGPASDVFSLGAVLTFAANGSEPFGEGPPVAVLHRVVSSEPRLDGLTDPARALVAACLAKDPTHRPTLRQLLDQITAHWEPPDDLPAVSPWPDAVTTLIHQRATPPTMAYTEPAGDPPLDAASTAAAPRQENQPPAPGLDDPDAFLEHAFAIGDAGRHAEAAQLMAALADDQARSLGSDHPEVLATRIFHVGPLAQAGEVLKAGRLMSDLVADTVRALGVDHPTTLRVRGLLAQIRNSTMNPAMLSEFEELLADRVRVLGADHPQTLELGVSLAEQRGYVGDHAGSITSLESLLSDHLRVLGPDHRDTLNLRELLARSRAETGDHAVAEAALEDVIADQVRVLGPDHCDTLAARRHLIELRSERDELEDREDPAQTVVEYERLLADHVRVLGPDHPGTLEIRGALIAAGSEVGDPASAVAAYRALLAELRGKGPSLHEMTAARTEFSELLARAGDFAGAVAVCEEMLTECIRRCGADHFATLIARACLADVRGRSGGEVALTSAEFEELFTDCLRLLGAASPFTRVIRAYLDALREHASNPTTPHPVFSDLYTARSRLASLER